VQLIRDIEEMKNVAASSRGEGKSIGLVPTMGDFHPGHLSLFRLSRERVQVLVVSVFVNPTQFGPGEDYEAYPRDLDADARMAQGEGVDLLFHPDVDRMYPDGYATYVQVAGLEDLLCGLSRPGHFRGVATVCLKLFHIVKPHLVVFGQKDGQQAVIVRKMIDELNLDVEMMIGPTVREPDGLAMSSRNRYLDEEERREASVLYAALRHAEVLIESGERNPEAVAGRMRALIERAPRARLEYVSLVDARTLKNVDVLMGDVLIALSCWFGKARLIDNLLLNIPSNETA
jgi:pantoate--beta-alanine ligase